MTISRRQLFAAAGATLGLAPILGWIARPDAAGAAATAHFPVVKSDAEWKAALTPGQYRVLREAWTEPAGTSPLNDEHRPGTFVCAGCGQPLFSSTTKYNSGTGWPSFYAPLDNAVQTSVDQSWFMVRTEVHCGNCGGHLGHVFADGPRPTGLRYCMNGTALRFVPATT